MIKTKEVLVIPNETLEAIRKTQTFFEELRVHMHRNGQGEIVGVYDETDAFIESYVSTMESLNKTIGMCDNFTHGKYVTLK